MPALKMKLPAMTLKIYRSSHASIAFKRKSCTASFYLEEMSLQAVTDATGWSLNNVKVILHRARKRIKIIINELIKKINMQADKFDLKIQELLTKTFNKQQGYHIEDAVMQNIQQKRNVVKLSKNNRKHSILLLVFTVILECTILFTLKYL